jgi:hypothetical protein
MRLGPDKLTLSKLDNMELREITGTTRSNTNSSIQTRVRSNSKQEQILNKTTK